MSNKTKKNATKAAAPASAPAAAAAIADTPSERPPEELRLPGGDAAAVSAPEAGVDPDDTVDLDAPDGDDDVAPADVAKGREERIRAGAARARAERIGELEARAMALRAQIEEHAGHRGALHLAATEAQRLLGELEETTTRVRGAIHDARAAMERSNAHVTRTTPAALAARAEIARIDAELAALRSA